MRRLRVVGAVFVLTGIFELSLRAGLIGIGIIEASEALFSVLKGHHDCRNPARNPDKTTPPTGGA